jgi:hypothetical protein
MKYKDLTSRLDLISYKIQTKHKKERVVNVGNNYTTIKWKQMKYLKT